MCSYSLTPALDSNAAGSSSRLARAITTSATPTIAAAMAVSTLILYMACQLSAVLSARVSQRKPPAMLTRPSRRPWAFSTSAMTRCQSASLVTSWPIARAPHAPPGAAAGVAAVEVHAHARRRATDQPAGRQLGADRLGEQRLAGTGRADQQRRGRGGAARDCRGCRGRRRRGGAHGTGEACGVDGFAAGVPPSSGGRICIGSLKPENRLSM